MFTLPEEFYEREKPRQTLNNHLLLHLPLFRLFNCVPDDTRGSFAISSLTFPSCLCSPAALPMSWVEEPHVRALWVRWQVICSGITPIAKRNTLPLCRCGPHHLLCGRTRKQMAWDVKKDYSIGNKCPGCGSPSLTEVSGALWLVVLMKIHGKVFIGNISDFFSPQRIQAAFPRIVFVDECCQWNTLLGCFKRDKCQLPEVWRCHW